MALLPSLLTPRQVERYVNTVRPVRQPAPRGFQSVRSWAVDRHDRKQGRPLDTVFGSAAAYRLDDRKMMKALRSARQDWQTKALVYFDEIPEAHFAHSYRGSIGSRLRLYAARRPAPDADPEPVEDDLAQEFVAEIATATGGQPDLLRDAFLNLSITGEVSFAALDPEGNGDVHFEALSIDELVILERQMKIRHAPGFEEPIDPANSHVFRVWQPHPRYSLWADSAMRALAPVCEELHVLTRLVRAWAVSRLANAGIITMPNNISFGPIDPTQPQNQDPFTVDFVETLMEAMQDPDSAAAFVPNVIRGHPDALKEIRHITFHRDIGPSKELREEAVERFARGIDLPEEIVLGKADLNHWTAWQVDEDTFRAHIEPTALILVQGLTIEHLRPRLLSAGRTQDQVDEMFVWYDPSAVIVKPDRSKDALQLHDRRVISDESLRNNSGFDDSDAPDDTELARRQAAEQPAPQTPADVGPANVDKAPPEQTAPAEPAAARTVTAGAQQVQIIETGGPDGPVIAIGGHVIAAGPPKSQRVRVLGAKLAQLDAMLRDRLTTDASAALARGLERAGARIRSKTNGQTAARIRDVIVDVPDTQVAAVLGPSVVVGLLRGRRVVKAAAGPEEEIQRILEGTFDTFGPRADRWIQQAQERTLALILEHADTAEEEERLTDLFMSRMDDDRDEAVGLLVGSLGLLATSRLFDPSPIQSGFGELTDSPVPPRLIREVLSVAGGARRGPGGTATPPGLPFGEGPIGGIGTGPIAEAALGEVGISTARFVWMYGVAPRRNFDPHEQLDGVEFDSWEAAELTVGDEGAWLGRSYYAPGDHDGCLCDFAWVTEPGGEPEALFTPIGAD